MSAVSHASSAPWQHTPAPMEAAWRWPVDPAGYDRTPDLTPLELAALDTLVARRGRQGHWSTQTLLVLARLRAPILDVLASTGASENARCGALTVLVHEMQRRRSAFWAWTATDWADTLCPTGRRFTARYRSPQGCRAQVLALAYLLGPPLDLDALGPFDRLALARKVFGRTRVDGAIQRVVSTLVGWGYRAKHAQQTMHASVCEALLAQRTGRLEDLTADGIDTLRQRTVRCYLRDQLYVLSRALFGLGITGRPPRKAFRIAPHRDPTLDVPAEWAAWCQRWQATSTLSPKARHAYYLLQLKAGRWAAKEQPQATTLEAWTRETAAAYVAAVDRMTIGQWADTRLLATKRLGQPIGAKAKTHHLAALGALFRDAQEWGWLPRRFDPRRCFAVPRTIRALLGPSPRVLADDLWAKLLWAGLNLTEADLTRTPRGPAHYYPLPLVRGLAIVWLFAGLRADELHRLRVGCVRWQREDVTVVSTGEVLPKDAVCLLDVPTNKTGTAFTKPVDRAVGEAIGAWEAVRPRQPALLDAKTGEVVDALFAYRGARVGETYLNDTLIPLLCRKAGVPEHDARGDITSHRARSTIASQLFNAKEPMSLFELQAWLGHRWPTSTQHYVRVAPTKLAKAYADAGYFARNVRTIEVLIDQEAVRSGAAARGEPWRLYDLGHGYCSYDFFDQCPHRLACAKCAFYRPKGSMRAQFAEGKANLLRMRQELPLTEEEVAAVEEGMVAYGQLLTKLADVPTPAGPTPRELGCQARPRLPMLPGAAFGGSDRATSFDADAAPPVEGVPEMEG